MSEVQKDDKPRKPQSQSKEMTGMIFGYLLVVRRSGSIGKQAAWDCICKCGTRKRLLGSELRYGRIKSCGCLRTEKIVSRSTTHGCAKRESTTTTYHSWASMIQRCTNKNHPRYHDYGGRGIKVCERWLDGCQASGLSGFECFLQDMGERPPACSLDRFPDNNGNYSVSNCRWATKNEQNSNKRSNNVILYKGEKLCLADAARKYNISRDLLKGRIRRGWSVEEAIESPTIFNSRWHSKRTPREPEDRKTP